MLYPHAQHYYYMHNRHEQEIFQIYIGTSNEVIMM